MKSINKNAPVTCSKSISINSSNEKVWNIMTDIDNWPIWQTDISKSNLKGELKPGSTFDWKSNGIKISSILHSVEPYRMFGWTGKTFGIFAIHNWTLTEQGGITIVNVDESMDGILAGIFQKSFNKNLEKGMHNWLVLLKKECEK